MFVAWKMLSIYYWNWCSDLENHVHVALSLELSPVLQAASTEPRAQPAHMRCSVLMQLNTH